MHGHNLLTTLGLSLSLLAVWPGSVPAENPQTEIAGENPPAPASKLAAGELSRFIDSLASPEFAARRAAFLGLWKAGKDALPLVSQAKSSTVRQVLEAATILEILLELDIPPGKQHESAKLLELLSNPTPLAVVQLCQAGYWDVGERLLKENSALVQQFQEPYGRYLLSRLVEAAVGQGTPTLAWPLVRQVAPLPLAVWIAHKTGLELEPQVAAYPYAQALRLFYAGDVEEALAIQVPTVVHLPMITRTGRWARLLDEPVLQALSGRQATPAQAAVQALLHEMAGDIPRSIELWKELLDAPFAKEVPARADEGPAVDDPAVDDPAVDDAAVDDAAVDDTPPADRATGDEPNEDVPQPPAAVGDATAAEDPQTETALRILRRLHASGMGGQAVKNQFLAALLFSGRVEPIEQFLMVEEPTAAFGFYLAGNNHVQALAALGLQADLANLGVWLEERKRLIAREFGQRPAENRYFDETARLCWTLVGLGFPAEAQRILDELVLLARLSRNSQQELWSRSLLRWLGRAEGRAMALRAAQVEFPRMNAECQAAVLEGLFPQFAGAALVLWQEAPGDDAESKWTNLERLWLWDRAHFAPQPPTLVSSWLRRTLEKLSSQGLTAEQLTALGEIASGFGDSELALELLTVDLTEANGDPNAINIHWLDAARIHTQRGMPHKALPLLADVRQSGSNTQRAFVQEVEALLLSGQYQKAEAIDQARWLRPLATTQFYQGANYLQIAREFSDAQQWESAQQYAEPAFWLADSGSMDIYWSAGRYSQILEEMGDRERAADVHRAALVEALQPYASSLQWLVSNDYYSSLRYAAQRDRLCRAVAAIEASDFATARHNIAVGRQLQPQDIEMVVQCYPRLQAAGQSELAQQLFDSYEQNMLQQLELWPQDATALNNLAWMYSQCDVKLDAALPLIRRAVELAPSSAVFLDTLAEVEFRSGDVAAALETMRSCVRLDPREAHYRENLVRFRKR